ncbi:MAG TPA: hypothetical protein VE222_12865 [Nitrospiraceae bacterium]|nr:hypothetical protein [Nitrospiraceae bacterium]
MPGLAELKTWFDSEYGGPLTVRADEQATESWHAVHGPWTAHIVIPLPATHIAGLKEQLAWEHEHVGAVAPSLVPPRDMPDTILFAARLARGLTLLTQGTAYDITTNQYVNPSDWQDRPLTQFILSDHIPILQGDDEQSRRNWCYTLGLSKFGVDELEMFLASGLPDQPIRDLLGHTADELIRTGQSPKVGSHVHVGLLGQNVAITNHRTAAPAGRMLSFREIRPLP